MQETHQAESDRDDGYLRPLLRPMRDLRQPTSTNISARGHALTRHFWNGFSMLAHYVTGAHRRRPHGHNSHRWSSHQLTIPLRLALRARTMGG